MSVSKFNSQSIYATPNILVHDAVRMLWDFNEQKLPFHDEQTFPILLSVAVNSTFLLMQKNIKNGKVTSAKYQGDFNELRDLIQYFHGSKEPVEVQEVNDFTGIDVNRVNEKFLKQIIVLLKLYKRNAERRKKWWRTRYTHWGGKRLRLTKKRRKR
jgi:hypothetical protein